MSRIQRRLISGYGSVRLQSGRLHVESGPTLLRRLDAKLLLDIGRWHRSAGRLSDSVRVLSRANALAPRNERVSHVLGLAAGELAVLSGSWRSPALTGAAPFEPVPGRVLHVVHKSLPWVQAGYTIRTQAIVASQRAAGLEPHVTTAWGFPSPDTDDAVVREMEHVDGIPHWHLLVPGGEAAPMDVRLNHRIVHGTRIVEAVRPSVLHAASDFLNAEVALAWGRAYGIPVVYEVRGFWADTWLAKVGEEAAETERYRGRQAREMACMQAADAIVTLAEVMKAEIVAQGIDPAKVTVNPNAVDVDMFTPGPRDEALARRWGIRPNEVTVGYISSLTHYEGIDLLLQAVAHLVAEGYPVTALIVGDGKERRRLEAIARQLRLGDRVVFTGEVPVSEVPAYYRLIDIFVVPRTADRVCRLVTPLKPYEAMASGCVVVASDVQALSEMIRHRETGLLFRTGDANELTRTIGKLLDECETRERLRERARQWVATHRTWDSTSLRRVYLKARTVSRHPAT